MVKRLAKVAAEREAEAVMLHDAMGSREVEALLLVWNLVLSGLKPNAEGQQSRF